ncbi:hypothetical protein [Listeria ilorinensis]|uniref:hypothetical protein n=1 Tax=Listeria ilorinensis TaxID=2867439 RepID=UPI001EF4B6A5|nr:hypothetical protein [Listeria ilorinensis]
MKVAGLTIGELIALITFAGTVIGFVFRFGLITPLKNMIQSLEEALVQLRIDMKDNKAELAAIREEMQKNEAEFDKRLSILENEKSDWTVSQAAREILEELKKGEGA